MPNKYLMGVIGLLFLLVSGCSTLNKSPTKIVKIQQAKTKRQVCRERLVSNNAWIWFTGDNIRIMLPADQLFLKDSANVASSAAAVIQDSVCYLNTFRLTDIKVQGFTDNQCSPARNQALSQARAQKVVDSLWRWGIDARVLYAKGYGHCQPMGDNRMRQGREINRRIEIVAIKVDDKLVFEDSFQ